MATVTYGTIEIDFRRATVADGLWREEIVTKLLLARAKQQGESALALLQGGDPMVLYYRTFGRIVSQAVTSKGLPFAVNRDSTDEQVVKAFECFFNQMEDEFFERCFELFDALRKPADPAMAPEGLPENADPNLSGAASKSKTGGAAGGKE